MLHSEALEGQVLVQPQDSLLPKENERRLMHGLNSLVDQLHSVPKGTEKVNIKKENLRFGCLDASRVLVLLLVVAEESLAGCS